MGDVRLAVLVHRHVAGVVDDDAGVLQPESARGRDRAHRQQHVAALDDAAVLAAHDHASRVRLLDRHRPGTLAQLDAALEEVGLERRGDLGVLLRQHLLAGDEQRDSRAERAEHVHELDPGHARADDDEVIGYLRRRVGLARGEHPLAVDGRPFGNPRVRAGGDEDRVGIEGAQLAVVGRDLDAVRTDEPARPAEDLDTLAEQLLGHRGGELVLDLPDPGAEQLEIDLGRERLQPAYGGPFREGDQASRGDHRLGRHAVPEIGGSTDDVPLDEGHLGSEPGGSRGGLHAGGAASDHDETYRHPAERYPPAPAVPGGRRLARRGSGLRQDGLTPGGAVAPGARLELGREGVEASLALAHAGLKPVQDGHALAEYRFAPFGTRPGAVLVAKCVEPVEGVEILTDLVQLEAEQRLQLANLAEAGDLGRPVATL